MGLCAGGADGEFERSRTTSIHTRVSGGLGGGGLAAASGVGEGEGVAGMSGVGASSRHGIVGWGCGVSVGGDQRASTNVLPTTMPRLQPAATHCNTLQYTATQQGSTGAPQHTVSMPRLQLPSLGDSLSRFKEGQGGLSGLPAFMFDRFSSQESR